MGLTQLIEPFYEALPASTFRRLPIVGQVCWVVVPHHDPIPRILDVEREDPRTHQRVEAEIRNIKESDFRKKNRLPIYKLTLHDNEELLAQRAKKRLAIVVCSFGSVHADVDTLLPSMGKKHLQERNVLVAPIYGSQTPEHPNGFPPIMRSRIGALMYSQFFPCAAHKTEPVILDGVARLDRLQPVCPQGSAYDPLPLALSDEALAVLLALARLRFNATQEPEIDGLRELLAETVPKEYRPPGP